MHPQNISIHDFSYELPEDKIAKFPVHPRDSSKLLIYNNNSINQDFYYHLANYIPEDSLVIFNNTKVVEARILFEKSENSVIEIFCLEPDEQYSDITSAMLQTTKVFWKCLVGGAKKWKDEWLIKQLATQFGDVEFKVRIKEKISDYFILEFCWSNDTLSFSEVLHFAGIIPLPPYIKRKVEEKDTTTYQTIYAKFNGSVAAPTAGLHFTDNLFKKLLFKNIKTSYVTLHVGAGTFKPVKAAIMHEHEMHAEFIEVSRSFINELLNNKFNAIIAVGTTSLRTMESLYWMGVKLLISDSNFTFEPVAIKQWDAYELPQDFEPKEALEALLFWMDKHKMQSIITKTQIIISPGYSLKIADALVTNFHQPQSTLLLLVAAIAGENWKKLYDVALENNFRFLSYGDGCLIWKQ
jgi:S-adenosylmethionine:tRNA ribosyltransferase-isomerase